MKLFKQPYQGKYGEIKHYVVPTDPDKKVIEKSSNGVTILATAGEERELNYYENLSEADLTKHEFVEFVPEVSKPAAVVTPVDPVGNEDDENATITYNSSQPGDNKVEAPEVNSDKIVSSSDPLSEKPDNLVDEVKLGGETIQTGEGNGQ